MLDFQPVSLLHKPLFDRALSAEGSGASCTSFGNVFLWDLYCRRNVAAWMERLTVEFICPRGPFYSYPIGTGELIPMVEAMHADAAEKGRPFTMKGVTETQKASLEAAFPGKFVFSADRDNSDYIYTVEALSTLGGKKLHGKRNFCNRFEAAHEWRYEPLTPARFEDCRTLLRQWEEEKKGDKEEQRAILRLLELWDDMGMTGGVLYAENVPIAFAIGERIRGDMVDVHFEKARDDVPGAYPMIARELARHIAASMPEVVYLNREEDMGLPGLRRAKEEWYPCAMNTVYAALWQEDT